MDLYKTYNMYKINQIGCIRMEVYEKINYLLEEKSISKKDFVDKLIALEPKLKVTGEVPSVQTIYRYLNGQREIKIELIPYIAEVLGVSEQELFSSDIEYASEYNIRYSKEAREILKLLPYVPKITIEEILAMMRKYKDLHHKKIKNINS